HRRARARVRGAHPRKRGAVHHRAARRRTSARGQARPRAAFSPRVLDRTRRPHDPGDAVRRSDRALRAHRQRRQRHEPIARRRDGHRAGRSGPARRERRRDRARHAALERRLTGMVEIRARETLCGADADALARCARDEAAWRALPKLGEARRSSVARLLLSAGPVVVKRYSDPAAFRLLTFARRSRAEREARALALIDLPYARAVARLGMRHCVRDLAILSLELRKFLDDGAWSRFLARYRAAAGELGAADVERVSPDRVARAAARAGHRTPLSAAV